MSRNVPEKVESNSPVGDGEGRDNSKTSRKRDASSETTKSELKYCDKSQPYARIVHPGDKERPQDTRDTHNIPIRDGEVGEVAWIHCARY